LIFPSGTINEPAGRASAGTVRLLAEMRLGYKYLQKLYKTALTEEIGGCIDRLGG